ncbi:MAG: WecB/TagA/CpsF family glycosyltransferase [Sedimentibacter sp.]|uniref:WecB/TagA/CpsF family glycosyltransferase n=1 Tax=Sedimentibacter sp. TaxID=1960295 RepID=UPI003158BAE6
MENKRFKLFNTYVDALSFDETIKEVEDIIVEKKPTQHVVINASKINLMQQDDKLTEIVNSCPLINADGASIIWAAKKLGIPVVERVTGIDLFTKLVEISDKKGYRIFLFGAKEEVVTKVKSIFENKYKNIKIVGYRNGYFTEVDEFEIVQQIAASEADIMFVAFSSPKKEYWINKYLNEMNVPFVMGVGGSFDVVAGVTDRAPKWMQEHGLEWFYRFIQEPKRMFKRYIIGNVKYVMLTYKTKFLLSR